MGYNFKMPKKSQQTNFADQELLKPKDSFGGSLLTSNPKTRRPLDSKLPIHLVLRSDWARMRLPKHFTKVNQTVRAVCKKHGVALYEYANVGNHLHMVIKIPQRRRWAAFIRELSGRIAQAAQSLAGQQKAQRKFWSQRPFTRVVRGWRKAFSIAKAYVRLNLYEAEGFISRKETKTLRDLREIWDP
jgi:REP element-mobilizing transposase RayT